MPEVGFHTEAGKNFDPARTLLLGQREELHNLAVLREAETIDCVVILIEILYAFESGVLDIVIVADVILVFTFSILQPNKSPTKLRLNACTNLKLHEIRYLPFIVQHILKQICLDIMFIFFLCKHCSLVYPQCLLEDLIKLLVWIFLKPRFARLVKKRPVLRETPLLLFLAGFRFTFHKNL